MLTLDDLCPQESVFSLSDKPGKIFKLKKFTLRDQIWAKQTFGPRIATIFEKQELDGIAEIAFHQLVEKGEFIDPETKAPSFLVFAENIVTQKDKLDLLKALLATIGMSQPVIEKLAQMSKEAEEKEGGPKPEAPEK